MSFYFTEVTMYCLQNYSKDTRKFSGLQDEFAFFIFYYIFRVSA